MSSLCHNLKTNYERLQTLTADFTTQYTAAKTSGDLTAIKQLKKELEAARDALRAELLVFIIPSSHNPYREALLAAGLPDGVDTAETKEMMVNIPEEIKRQCAVYAEATDADGKPLLQDWVNDISNNQHMIAVEVAKDYAKIVERIKAGMVPVVMPSRSVQEATWEEAQTKLKPVWKKSGELKPEAVDDAYLYGEYKTQKMNQAGFFKNIPDRPYIVWTKPGQKPDAETCDKTFDDQREYYAKLVKENPNLYDETDVLPTEYIALQAIFTHAIQGEHKKVRGESAEPNEIKPLDHDTYTRFLSTGLFSDGHVPYAYFHPDYRQVRFHNDNSDAHDGGGFRPAARS